MPVIIPNPIQAFPYGQPLLFNDELGNDTWNGQHLQTQENDCRNYDNRLYFPFYVIGTDLISLQFKAYSEGQYDAEGDCIAAYNYGIKLINDSGGASGSMQTTSSLEKEIDSVNNISQYSFNIDPYGLTEGCYHLEIYLTGTLGLCANDTISLPYLVASSQQIKLYTSNPDCAIQIDWTNNSDIFDFIYCTSPGSCGIGQGMRLICLQWKPKYDEDGLIFKDSKSNEHILAAVSNPVYELLIDEVPEFVHNALRLAKLHDTFKINGVQYTTPAKGYNPEWNNLSKFAQVRLEISKYNGESIRSNC